MGGRFRPIADIRPAPIDAVAQPGQMRYSLWTGDLGFGTYLSDCIRGTGAFPTLETFFTGPADFN